MVAKRLLRDSVSKGLAYKILGYFYILNFGSEKLNICRRAHDKARN